jgi:hypothetical protein
MAGSVCDFNIVDGVFVTVLQQPTQSLNTFCWCCGLDESDDMMWSLSDALVAIMLL